MASPGSKDECQVIVTNILGQDWQIQPVGESLTEFEVTLTDDALSVKQAWEKSYELRSQPDVVNVEPLFTVPVVASGDIGKLQPQAIFDGEIDQESNDVQWGLKQMGVLQVWQQYFPHLCKAGKYCSPRYCLYSTSRNRGQYPVRTRLRFSQRR